MVVTFYYLEMLPKLLRKKVLIKCLLFLLYIYRRDVYSVLQ